MLILLYGCAHVISYELREMVDKGLSAEMLFKDPDRFKGKTVILGGIIVSAKNTDKGTYIEVMQKPLNYRGRPKDVDVSYGRFIIYHEEYLDSVIYSKGKEIAVGGKVLGKIERLLGELQYSYPLIQAREIHLFSPRSYFPIHFSIGVFSDF